MGSQQVLSLQVWVELGVILIKMYPTIFRILKLEPQIQMQFLTYARHVNRELKPTILAKNRFSEKENSLFDLH